MCGAADNFGFSVIGIVQPQHHVEASALADDRGPGAEPALNIAEKRVVPYFAKNGHAPDVRIQCPCSINLDMVCRSGR